MSNIDPSKPEAGLATTSSVRDNFAAAAAEIDANAAAISVNASGISDNAAAAAAAQATADTALANAATAQAAADAAQAAADAAQGTADTALTNANAAQGDATQALADAAAAQVTANAAQGDATQALADAATAQAAAVAAQGTADTALANAATADGKAVAAQGTADTALANAATADGKAVAAQGTADGAVSVNTTQDGRLAGIDTEQITQNERLTALESVPPASVEFPVGAYMMGFDPTGIFPGTWVAVPEGTFLMATIAGADPAGGSNDAVAIEHNHTATQAAHTHGLNSTNDPNNNAGGTNAICSNASTMTHTTLSATPAITVVAAGVPGTNLNRPKYIGIAVYQRTV